MVHAYDELHQMRRFYINGGFDLKVASGSTETISTTLNITVLHMKLNSFITKQDKSEGFDSCDRPSNRKFDSNRQSFRPCDREI